MADKYYDYNAAGGGDGSLSTPYNTRSLAVSNSITGDKVVAVDGLHAHESGHFVFDDARDEVSNTYRGATLQANTAETTRVARTSGSLTAGNNPFIANGIIFDGESGNGGAGVTQAMDIGQDAAEDLIIQLHNCKWISGTTYGLLLSNRRGRLEIVNGEISGALASRLFGATSSLSGDGNQVIDIQRLAVNPVGVITGSKKCIELAQVGAPANILDIYFKGLSGLLTIGASATVTLLDIKTKNDCTVSGFDLELNADDAAASVVGIIIRGNSAGHELTNGIISKGSIKLNSPSGFGISFGLSTTDSHITGGIVTGNAVTGKHYASDTPHNYVMGQGTAGELKGNTSVDGYVGFLFSITDTCDASANVAFDCYGPSYYVKGTTAATLKDNIAICSGKYVQRDRGILSVAPQGASDTAGATIQENLVIVQDLTKIHSLGYIEDVNQVCTFVRNTYIVPSEQYVEGNDYFSYQNGAGGAANNTLAEWNAQSEVADDVIVPMPQAEIAALIKTYKEKISPTPKIMIDTSGNDKVTVGWKVIR